MSNDLFEAAQAGDLQTCCELAEKELHFTVGLDRRMEEIVKQFITFSRHKGSLLVKLILGESGSGKGLYARLLHEMSVPGNPFLVCNVGGMNELLADNELFGHVKGGFTDAKEEKKGLLQIAGKGTVLLDEVGDAHLSTQKKLLGAASNGRAYYPVGSTEQLVNNAQLICATNRDLDEAVKVGAMREDFLYRISGLVFCVPSWKDRDPRNQHQTIRALVAKFAGKYGHDLVIEQSAIDCLLQLPIRGNVRGIEDLIERAVFIALSCTSERILPKHIVEAGSLGLAQIKPKPAALQSESGSTNQKLSSKIDYDSKTLHELEREGIVHSMKACALNKVSAAKILGINRSTLDRKLRVHFKTIDVSRIQAFDDLTRAN